MNIESRIYGGSEWTNKLFKISGNEIKIESSDANVIDIIYSSRAKRKYIFTRSKFYVALTDMIKVEYIDDDDEKIRKLGEIRGDGKFVLVKDKYILKINSHCGHNMGEDMIDIARNRIINMYECRKRVPYTLRYNCILYDDIHGTIHFMDSCGNIVANSIHINDILPVEGLCDEIVNGYVNDQQYNIFVPVSVINIIISYYSDGEIRPISRKHIYKIKSKTRLPHFLQ